MASDTAFCLVFSKVIIAVLQQRLQYSDNLKSSGPFFWPAFSYHFSLSIKFYRMSPLCV